MKHLNQLVRVTPGFKASVSIQTDLDDPLRIKGYIPTMFSARLLDEIALGVAADATNRVFLVHGAYGTGKSHLALVVSAYLGAPWTRGHFAPVLDKIQGMDATLASTIRKSRESLEDPLLVVPLYGSEARTRESLLLALNNALRHEGLQGVMPETAFEAAILRITQIQEAYPESVPDMVRAFSDQGYPSLESIIQDLRQFKREALAAFDAAHPQFSRGAHADHVLAQRPESVYRAVSSALRQLPRPQRRSGILVLWDEFGLHLERVLSDFKQDAYLDLQSFAEQCSGSGEDRLFFLGLAHRSIEQTVSMVTGLPTTQRETLNRIAGRFTQRRVVSGPGEQFGLLSRVLLPVDPQAIAEFWRVWGSWSGNLTRRVQELKLFGSMSDDVVEEIIVRNTFPMHPVATFLLAVISEKVAQNDRTLFHFLSDTGPDGLPAFIQSEPVEVQGRLNVLSGDRLFPFFAPMIAASRQDEVKAQWTRFRKVAPQSDPLRKRILEVILLLATANRPELRPSPVGIALALGYDLEGVAGINAILEQMRKEKLVRRLANGEFELRNVDGEVDLLEAIESAISDIPLSVDLTPFWERWASASGVGGDVIASGHNERYSMNRACHGEIASVKDLRDSRYKEQGAPRGVDGITYWTVPASEAEYEEALRVCQTIENPRVLVVLPPTTPVLTPLARKFIAIGNLQRQFPQAFGPSGIQREEWETELKEVESELTAVFREAYQAPVVYFKGKPRRCQSADDLKEAATSGMDEAFPLTLRIPHERLIDTLGNDTQKVHRAAVVQATLFSPLDQLAEMPVKPVAFIVDSVLKANGWLRRTKGDWVLARPNHDEYPNGAAVWDKINTHIRSQTKKLGTLRFLVDELIGPPFGLRPRTIPVLLAAVVRSHAVSLAFVSQGGQVELSAELIEKMVRDPGSVSFIFAALKAEQRWVLDQVVGTLASGPASDQAPLKQAEKLISQFVMKLPKLTRTTSKVSGPALRMRDEVLVPIAEGLRSTGDETSLRQVLFEVLPALCGLAQLNSSSLSAIKGTVGTVFPQAMEELKSLFEALVTPVVADVFGAKSPELGEIQQAVRSFVDTASTRPRRSLNPSEAAFIDAAMQLAPNPLAHLDELAAALGFRPAQTWTDEDLIALRTKGTVLRENLLASEILDEGDRALAPEGAGASQEATPKEPSSGRRPVMQKAPFETPEPSPTPTRRLRPTASKISIAHGGDAITMTVGGVLPHRLKYALTAVQTALRGQALSKEERVQILAEVLADELESGHAQADGGN